jgi:hypothetical protein
LDKSTKKTFLVVLVPALGAVLIGFFQYVLPFMLHKPPPAPSLERMFAGRVTNEQSGKLLESAKVSLEAKGLSPVTYTDSEGRFSFRLNSDTNEIRIRVDAQGYRPFERKISVSAKTEPEDIRLTPAEPAPTPEISVAAPPPKPRKPLTLEERKRRALEDLNSTRSSPLH